MKVIAVDYTERRTDIDELVTVYFSAPHRVDFRGLVRELAREVRARVDLRQIGARDEARMQTGLGPCGRDTCCSTFLKDFEPVSVRMAKDQDLPLNPLKISGACGRLMCCLKYEHPAVPRLQEVGAQARCPCVRRPHRRGGAGRGRGGRLQRAGRRDRDQGPGVGPADVVPQGERLRLAAGVRARHRRGDALDPGRERVILARRWVTFAAAVLVLVSACSNDGGAEPGSQQAANRSSQRHRDARDRSRSCSVLRAAAGLARLRRRVRVREPHGAARLRRARWRDDGARGAAGSGRGPKRAHRVPARQPRGPGRVRPRLRAGRTLRGHRASAPASTTSWASTREGWVSRPRSTA